MKFKSQICTTREQSQRLLALGLNPETADMSILDTDDTPHRTPCTRPFHSWSDTWKRDGHVLPAWSLARLLELLPSMIKEGTHENIFGLYHEIEGTWTLSYPGIEYFETASPIESCLLAIDRLIAGGHFNKEYLI